MYSSLEFRPFDPKAHIPLEFEAQAITQRWVGFRRRVRVKELRAEIVRGVKGGLGGCSSEDE